MLKAKQQKKDTAVVSDESIMINPHYSNEIQEKREKYEL